MYNLYTILYSRHKHIYDLYTIFNCLKVKNVRTCIYDFYTIFNCIKVQNVGIYDKCIRFPTV